MFWKVLLGVMEALKKRQWRWWTSVGLEVDEDGKVVTLELPSDSFRTIL